MIFVHTVTAFIKLSVHAQNDRAGHEKDFSEFFL